METSSLPASLRVMVLAVIDTIPAVRSQGRGRCPAWDMTEVEEIAEEHCDATLSVTLR